MKNILLIQIEFLSLEEKNINSTTLKFYLPKKTMSLTIYIPPPQQIQEFTFISTF